MNFLKSFFARKSSRPSAKEALREIRARIKSGKCSLFDALFYSVVGPADQLSCFGQANPFMGNSIHYVGGPDYDKDVVRFELAAFWMARADSYLFSYHRGSHEAIFGTLSSKFAEIFSVALNLSRERVRDLLADRLQKYNDLFRTEPNENKILTLVSAAVHDSLRNGDMPQSRIRDQAPPAVTVNDLVVVKSLGNMEAAFSPQMRSAIDKVVSLSKR